MGKGAKSDGRKSLKLDRSRLKSVSPDIGEVWLNQKKIRRLEIAQLKKNDKAKTAALKKILQDKRNRLLSLTRKNKKFILAGGVFVVIAGGAFLVASEPSEPDVLGGSTAQQGGSQTQVQNDGRTDEKPPFDPLYPSGKTAETLAAVTRQTPSGEIIHTFRDYINGVEVEVTEQALPEAFKVDPAAELEKLATGFQATSIIQVDGNKIFHGINESTNIQTVIFQKADVLVFIRSAQKLNDDAWVGFVLSLEI